MHEVEQEERSGNSVNTKSEIRMILTRSPCLDKKRYNVAACNEVAVVFVSEDSDPPIERDICIYEKASDKPIRIPNITKHVAQVEPNRVEFFKPTRQKSSRLDGCMTFS